MIGIIERRIFLLDSRLRDIVMHTRDYFHVRNQKKNSPIQSIYRMKKSIHVIFRSTKDQDSSDARKILDDQFEWGYAKSAGVPYKANIKDIVFALGLKYLSFSVFKELGFSDDVIQKFALEELEQAGIRPKSLFNICSTFVEQSYWRDTLFWGQIQLLPQDIKDHLPSLTCDTEEKLKAKYEDHEINKRLYKNFYCK